MSARWIRRPNHHILISKQRGVGKLTYNLFAYRRADRIELIRPFDENVHPFATCAICAVNFGAVMSSSNVRQKQDWLQ
jgi:hypothetical protein